MSAAPAATAARITSACCVDRHRHGQLGGQGLDHGDTRSISSWTDTAGRPAAWTATDVDQVGAFRREFARAAHGASGLPKCPPSENESGVTLRCP